MDPGETKSFKKRIVYWKQRVRAPKPEGVPNGGGPWLRQKLLFLYLPLPAWGRGAVWRRKLFEEGNWCLLMKFVYQVCSACPSWRNQQSNPLLSIRSAPFVRPKGILWVTSRHCCILCWSEGVISKPEVSEHVCLLFIPWGPPCLLSNMLTNLSPQ